MSFAHTSLHEIISPLHQLLGCEWNANYKQMAPVPMESILQAPTWPASLATFVTQCLMWDPRNRPTSIQALQHEYFKDAVDPLLPRSNTPSRMLRKQSDLGTKQSRDSITDSQPTLEKKNSWFRKSFIGTVRGDGVVSPPPTTTLDREFKPKSEKRSTWHAQKVPSGSGVSNNAAPMMILPTIRPVSPLSDAVSVEAARARRENHSPSVEKERRKMEEKTVKKLGRQLSVASTNSQNGNGYSNVHVAMAAERLNGNANGGLASPPSAGTQKESFFSHLRKRARRLSGKNGGLPGSPGDEDLEAGIGCGIAWGGNANGGSNRSSMLVESPSDVGGFDRAIRDVDGVLDDSNSSTYSGNKGCIRRNSSFPPTPNGSRAGEPTSSNGVVVAPISSRTRRSVRNARQRYETPDENDELVDEVLAAASSNYRQENNETPNRRRSQRDLRHASSGIHAPNGYPTPSPQMGSRANSYSKAVDVLARRGRREEEVQQPKWPTPPSEGDGWGAYTAAIARR